MSAWTNRVPEAFARSLDERNARTQLYGTATRSGHVSTAVPMKSPNNEAATDRQGSAAA